MANQGTSGRPQKTMIGPRDQDSFSAAFKTAKFKEGDKEGEGGSAGEGGGEGGTTARYPEPGAASSQAQQTKGTSKRQRGKDLNAKSASDLQGKEGQHY